MPRGVIMNRDLANAASSRWTGQVTEDVTRGWYEDGDAQASL
jgi:hypothetical protein